MRGTGLDALRRGWLGEGASEGVALGALKPRGSFGWGKGGLQCTETDGVLWEGGCSEYTA